MPDYTIGIAERIASVADSTATSNSVNRNYFQETSQSVVNVVNVAIAPPAPTPANPTPDTTYATATDGDSVSTFGVQETPIVITLLATIEDAGALAEYLIRSVPAFWFSNLAVSLNTLSEANKNIIANLEIGQQIAVTKTFPAGVVPQTVTEYLFVEGISHRVTPETHVVTIYTGPATTYLQWTLSNYLSTTTRTNLATNPSFETSVAGWAFLFGSGTVSQSSTFAYAGTYSARTETTAAGSLFSVAQTNISVTPGQAYSFSAYVRSSVARQCRVFIQWYNGGTFLSNSPNTLVTSSTSSWTRLVSTGTAPATATFGYLAVRTESSQIGDLVYWDAFLMETGSTLLPYFDGTDADTYTGYTLISQQWNGTANASTSTASWGLTSSQTGSPLNDSTYGLD